MVSPPPPLIKGLDSKVAVLGYFCVCLNALLFDYLLLITGPQNYYLLTREDSWVENLTAILFFLASLLLVATTLVEQSAFRRCIYALGAIAMVFIAGEEISWGQRILGFATPDLLLDLNAQREFNLHNFHNIGIRVTYKLYSHGSVILFMVTSAAFFCQKSTLFGIPLPSMLLVFNFLVGVVYASQIGEIKILLLLFVIYTLFSRQTQWLITAVTSLILILTLLYVDRLNLVSIVVTSERHEVQEYLFGIACLFYALELWLAQRRPRSARALPADVPDVAPVRTSRMPPWLAVYSFVIIFSVGLLAFQFFKAKAIAADVEEIYQSIVSGKYGEPVVRSTFDVYLADNQLIYFKEPCIRADFKKRFFLHLIPADENKLPDDRKQYGFDNLDFNFGLYNPSGHFDKKCITKIPLPDYTIDRIRTGQYVPGERQLWKAEASFP